MFTGIVENQGLVTAHQLKDNCSRLIIDASFADIIAGESIAVNGVCLTVLPGNNSGLQFDVSPETMQLTALGALSAGDTVNLERAMQAHARFGGHYVSGHVDAVAQVIAKKAIGDFIEMEVAGFSDKAMLYLIPKGSISVEGVSLTINAVSKQSIKIMLVPHTLANTNLGLIKTGQHVNIEFDYLTRIVAHQLQVLREMNYEEAS